MSDHTFDFKAYIPQALRTEAPLPTALDRLKHAALGLITETGEFTTEVKRISIYGKALDDTAKGGGTLRTHIAEEIGDTLWYVAIAADALALPAQVVAYSGGTVTFDYTLNRNFLQETSLRITQINGLIVESILDRSEADRHLILPQLILPLLHNLNVLAQVIGTDLQAIADDNIAKLQARYPDKFSAEDAEARADKGGLDARNS